MHYLVNTYWKKCWHFKNTGLLGSQVNKWLLHFLWLMTIFFFLMYNHTTIQNWIFSQKLFGEKNPTYAMYSISPVVVTLHSSVYCLVSSALHLKTDQMVWNWQFKAVRLIKKIVTIFQTPRNFRVNE